MNWKDILLPWGTLKEIQKEITSHIQRGVMQAKKIAGLEQDIAVQKDRIKHLLKQNNDLDLQLRSARLANTILKEDLRKLSEVVEALPKRNEKGRFTPKNPAEALRKLKKSLPQKEAK
jgi:chromosome segregation ATPase